MRKFLNISLFFIAEFASPSALGVPEKELESLGDDILAFYDTGKPGYLLTADQTRISYRYFPKSKTTTIFCIFTGRTESKKKYAEIVYDLRTQPAEIFLMDWRGQGNSQRILEDPNKGHISDYEQYYDDAISFFSQVIEPQRRSRQVVALAHSMGGNVMSVVIARNPQIIDKLVLSSPMLDIPVNFPSWLAWSVARGFELIGRGEDYTLGHSPQDFKYTDNTTGSKERYAFINRIIDRSPEDFIRGATNSWVRASIDATWQMKELAPQMNLPIIMFQAGRDELVRSEGQDIVCKKAPQCKKIHFANSKHESLQEIDDIRNKAFNLMLEFADM